MKLLPQTTYREPQDANAYPDHPLVVHRHDSTHRPRGLIIFVHGLTGSRYGYWHKIPAFLFKDMPEFDIGIYYYETALKRIGRFKSIELQEEAEVLADELRNLQLYERIAFVAHSMGGILVRGALVRLIDLDRRRTLRSIVGVVLAASPTLGSLRVPWWSLPFSPDARALYPHNAYLQRLSSTLNAHINPAFQQSGVSRRKTQVPFWALLGSHDFWVDKLSAGGGLPDSQVQIIRAPHSCIAADDRDHDGYQYIKGCLHKAFGVGAAEASEEPEIRCEDATEEDASLVHDFAVRMLGEGVTPTEEIAELIRAKGVIKLVKEVEVDGDCRTERVTGYFCALALSAQAAEQLKEGQMTGAGISGRHLAAPGAEPACIYIGAIAGSGAYPKSMILRELKYFLQSQLAKKSVELLTRPISADGERLARKYGFKEMYRGNNGQVLWACSNWAAVA